ncbi:MAG: helix-turn-helix domain-containing protein [Anaerolineae bacterium]|nr:helix-turn-helix domain-containing protein [Anaerolineae bacterium]
MNYNPFTVTGFAGRLQAALAQQGMSQSQLATVLGVSRSTVTSWVRYGTLPDAGLLGKLCDSLRCSADWLLGLKTHIEKQDVPESLHWVEQIPPLISGVQREQIEYGIRLFNLLVTENRSAEEVRAANGRLALQAALRSGAIRLTQVKRNAALEDGIRARYPGLKDVVVADVPLNYDDSIIRAELVTFLAANTVLTQAVRESAIGLGSGYTLLRLCEQSIPSIDQFSGTRWVPLLAFAPENTNDYDANTLARLMAMRHPGSQAMLLPHPDECTTKRMKAIQAETLRWMKNVQTIFVSVSGVDRRDRSGRAYLYAEFRSADYAAEAPDLRAAYAELPSGFGAELLRYLLDENGQIISSDPAVGAQVDLDILRYNCAMIGKVCIVAARAYKAQAVATCLRNGLANAIVVDSEIGEYLVAS